MHSLVSSKMPPLLADAFGFVVAEGIALAVSLVIGMLRDRGLSGLRWCGAHSRPRGCRWEQSSMEAKHRHQRRDIERRKGRVRRSTHDVLGWKVGEMLC